MEMDKGLIDKLLGDYQKPEDLIGENGLLKQLTRAIVERALQAELTTHLGYEKHSPEGHMYGPPRECKRKMKVTGWSAQMYTAFDGDLDSWPGWNALRSAPI